MNITENIKKNKQKVICNSKRICIGSKHKGDYVNVSDIIYVEAYANYSWLHLKQGKKLLSYKPIKYYENILKPHEFIRIHRSYLVNIHYVKTYEKKYRLLYLKGNIMLSVSYRRNHRFSKIITDGC